MALSSQEILIGLAWFTMIYPQGLMSCGFCHMNDAATSKRLIVLVAVKYNQALFTALFGILFRDKHQNLPRLKHTMGLTHIFKAYIQP